MPSCVLHAAYAHTYVLEDAYLSALANGLGERKLENLPDTQAAQRAAIIGWRTGLTVLAHRAGVALPADLQQAGRGGIAPAPEGSGAQRFCARHEPQWPRQSGPRSSD